MQSYVKKYKISRHFGKKVAAIFDECFVIIFCVNYHIMLL